MVVNLKIVESVCKNKKNAKSYCFAFLRNGGYVRVDLTSSMRRILSANLLRRHCRLLGRNLPSHSSLSVGKRSVLGLKFCSEKASESSRMDLSNMRKTYKGDAEVRNMQSFKLHWIVQDHLTCWSCNVMKYLSGFHASFFFILLQFNFDFCICFKKAWTYCLHDVWFHWANAPLWENTAFFFPQETGHLTTKWCHEEPLNS